MKSFISAAVLLLIPISALASGQRYNITPLYTDNGAKIIARSINDLGQVAGTSNFIPNSWSTSGNHAVLTGPNGIGVVDLGLPGGASNATAIDVNNEGLAVINSGSYTYLWDPETQLATKLPAFNQYGHSAEVVSINDNGVIAGFGTFFPNGWNRPRAYTIEDISSGPVDLGTLEGDFFYSTLSSHSTDINNKGDVVGYAEPIFNYPEPYVHAHAIVVGGDGVMVDLGTLGGGDSFAEAINDSGQIVGRSMFSESSAMHAFIALADGSGMRDLGALGGFSSKANDINNMGVVVGTYSTGNPLGIESWENRAFISNADATELYDLTSIVFPNGGGVRFSDAEAINNNGQILAWGEGMYYLLSPVPEQPVFIMMLAGLLFVSGFVRARKKFC